MICFDNKQVLDSLLHSENSPAPNITSLLKLCGNGKMPDGIVNVYKAGFEKGAITTVTIVGAAISGCAAVKNIMDHRRTKKELASIPILEVSGESDDHDSNDSAAANRNSLTPQNESTSEE